MLASTAMLLMAPRAGAKILAAGTGMPWRPFAGDPRESVKTGPHAIFASDHGVMALIL